MFSTSLFLGLVLAACGGSDSKTTPDAKAAGPDAPSGIDAANGADAPAATCTVSTDNFGDRGALTGTAYFDDSGTPADATDDILEFDAPLEGAAPSDVAVVQLYAGYGPFTGAVVPGTYQLTGEELNFATCGVCVRLATNATSTGYDDDYMATGGTVTITTAGTAIGGTLTGTLTNVTFGHVDIAPQTGETTPAGDSCTTQITNGTFTGTLAAPPA